MLWQAAILCSFVFAAADFAGYGSCNSEASHQTRLDTGSSIQAAAA